jgi:hypothetical protein
MISALLRLSLTNPPAVRSSLEQLFPDGCSVLKAQMKCREE